MQTDAEFNAEQNARERTVLRTVKQLTANANAVPMITARLPFVNKNQSFRGTTVFGLKRVEPDFDPWSNGNAKIGAHYFARNDVRGTFGVTMMPREFANVFYADLEEISSYWGNVYVVTSYSTVIAWTRGVENSGALVMPRVAYSQTTAKHQEITLTAGASWLESNGA